MHIRALVHRRATSSPWHMKTRGFPRSTPRVVLHGGAGGSFAHARRLHTPGHTSKAPLPPPKGTVDKDLTEFVQSPPPPLPPPKMLFFRVSCACPRVRSFGWWVSWGEGRGNTLIPPTAHPKMRPRREFSSQRKESHQSHWAAVLFAHSRWRDFLSLCLYYVVVCGFIRDWVGTAQNRTRVIVYITSAQIVGYGCLPLLSSRCFPESLSSMAASGRGFPRTSPAGLPDVWQAG